MKSVFDVANYIISKCGEMTTMKLHKLVYYSQAWHLVWTENALFKEKIEAWKNGPVVPELFQFHRGQFKISARDFNDRKCAPLDEVEQDTVDRVLKHYGHRDPQWLSQLTHLEDPWKNTRVNAGVVEGNDSCEEITHQIMFEYYSVL